MVKDLLDDHGVLHTGDDAHRALALLAGFNVDIEYPFQTLGPGHCHVALDEAAVIPFLIGLLAPLAPAWGCDQSPMLAVMSMDGRYAENAGAFFCGERTHRGIWSDSPWVWAPGQPVSPWPLLRIHAPAAYRTSCT